MSAPAIFDRRLVRLHRDRAAARVDRVAPILSDLSARLIERLDDITRRFGDALDIGGRGFVAPLLRARGMRVVSCDLSAAMARRSGMAVVADEEQLPFGPGSFDLVVACMALHWVNDLPGALIQIRHALRPGGLLLASVPVLDTLGELRRALMEVEAELAGGAAPRVSPFPDLRDCAALLQRAGYDLPVADVEEVQLSYAEGVALLRDLQCAGESNALTLRDPRIPSRMLFPAALARTGDGRVAITLRVATMTGWAR